MRAFKRGFPVMERHAASTEVSYTALTGLQELIEETVTSGELLPPQLKVGPAFALLCWET